MDRYRGLAIGAGFCLTLLSVNACARFEDLPPKEPSKSEQRRDSPRTSVKLGDEELRALGSEFGAKLSGLQDGDSFIAQTDKGRVTIRLSGVDAPEHTQAFGAQSRANFQSLMQGKPLRIKVIKQDQYQRLVAEVYVLDNQAGKQIDVGLAQLEAGLAWHYRQYAKEQPLDTRLSYARAEEAARAERRGLWQDLDTPTPPLAPWEFRKQKREAGTSARP